MEELLTKYFNRDITTQEKRLLFDAMDTDAALRKEFYALQNAIAMAGCMEEESDAAVGTLSYTHFKKSQIKSRLLRLALHSCKYAALIAIVASCVYFLTCYKMNGQLAERLTEVVAPSGQRVKVKLPDGTVAWLSPRSTLCYAASFNSKDRNVQLEGSTFFEVAHNAKKPFRIATGNYQITVLGTSFNVMAYPESERFELDLVEGCVQIDNTTDPTDRLILRPHERAVLVNKRLCKQVSEFDNEEYLKNGIVSFKSRPFGEILDNVALWQGVTLTIDPTIDVNRPVTGKFRQSDSLESILRVLQSIADFHYTITGENQVTIYR